MFLQVLQVQSLFVWRCKIDVLWLRSVSFDRLVGRCCWVCSFH